MINVPERFELTRSDRASDLWSRLEKYLEGERDKLRRQNDKDLPERETAVLRGSIQQINRILALGKDPIVPE